MAKVLAPQREGEKRTSFPNLKQAIKCLGMLLDGIKNKKLDMEISCENRLISAIHSDKIIADH